MTLLLLLLLGTGPWDAWRDPVTHRVATIELNHVFERLPSHDRHVLSQWIFWGQYPEGLHVVDWRMRKGQWLHSRRGRGHMLIWHEGGRHFRVHSKSYRQTRTLYDPEVLDRDKFHKDKRRLIK